MITKEIRITDVNIVLISMSDLLYFSRLGLVPEKKRDEIMYRDGLLIKPGEKVLIIRNENNQGIGWTALTKPKYDPEPEIEIVDKTNEEHFTW